MKKTRIFAALAASTIAVSAMTAAVSAYDLGNFDLGIGWSNSIVVPPEELTDLTADSVITVTFEADPYENEYWCLKPLVDDGGWTFIVDYAAAGEDFLAALSEPNHDTFGVEPDMTSVTFKVPAAAVDKVKATGLIFMGHSLVLKEMTISNDAPPANNGGAGATNGAGADPDKSSPETGVEGVAAVAGVALLASAAVIISRKRK